jgi:membrane-bound lytic murein transglycosylase D
MLYIKSKYLPLKLLFLVATLQLGSCSNLSPAHQTSDSIDRPLTPNLKQKLDEIGVEVETAQTISTENIVETVSSQMIEQAAQQDLWPRLREGFKLTPEVLPSAVIKQQALYLKNPRYLNTIFDRAKPYIFFVTEQLENAGLPLELALLPIVESSYDPLAYSPSHAVGLWQFIPSTGKSMGLHRDRWYEGRRDVIRSTEAAVKYLSYLNKRFDGDWLLALAAYNSGQGAVTKAIKNNRRRGKPSDFWSLKLPRETKNYVPRLLALADLVSDPQAHQLELPSIPNKAFFNRVELTSQIELNKVVEVTGVSESLFIKLNPAFRRSVTPPEGTYHILLPIGASQTLKSFLANNQPSAWTPYREYQVRSGDTLSHIAQRHQLSIELIKNTNGLQGDFLRIGQTLRIPSSGEIAIATEFKSLQILRYTVVAGDTISEIAERFKTSTRTIKRSNNLTSNTIKVGQTLLIKAPSTSAMPKELRKLSYRVRRGDSLYLIAEKFNLSITDITQWNNLQRDKYLQPGQRLTLYINSLRI